MSWQDQGRQEHGWFGHNTTSERILLAQATSPNRTTDIGPDDRSAATAIPGRYIAENPRQWIGQRPAGTGECVALVRAATNAPRSAEWRPGAQVQGNVNIRPGTAIATFDDNGRYDGHAAIYLGQDADGIRVIDQWNVREGGRIVRQHQPNDRVLPFGQPLRARINRGESYRVVE